ncbi:MFS transporter [Cohaesibacter celericrescens]|uniref:MFS transporter n=1 Tax=Cohaesibacter celericrescens TaxID=2067669 RepID=A0A2N5XSZ5_9HYPH|nr:MFS transporter [Cohaesibacter celericrescens]PLW77577.1 MFS transporter [Cohaesibacter celericrescens]
MTIISIKSRSLALLCLSQVAVLSLWFSASAVAPGLASEFALSGDKVALLSSSVQAGFVIGCLISAGFGLADRTDPRVLYAVCAVLGALANYAFIYSEPGSNLSIVLRLATGAVIAGVYPVGMKIAMSWARKDAGMLVGMLVGSLMIGSAAPHLIAFWGDVDWRAVLLATSWISAIGGLSVMLVAIGPNFAKSPKFKLGLAFESLTNKPIRLANFGYFGHMWEVYAMWAWIALFLGASFEFSGVENPQRWASLMTFFTIAAGAPGSMIGGMIADRIGRTLMTSVVLAMSGTCALIIGPLFGGPVFLVCLIAILWGATVSPDSAQFSTAVGELSKPENRGTMLTMQTAIGFSLALVSVQLMPHWIALVGWHWAFTPLVAGPVFGIVSMLKLRKLPQSQQLAGGKR